MTLRGGPRQAWGAAKGSTGKIVWICGHKTIFASGSVSNKGWNQKGDKVGRNLPGELGKPKPAADPRGSLLPEPASPGKSLYSLVQGRCVELRGESPKCPHPPQY